MNRMLVVNATYLLHSVHRTSGWVSVTHRLWVSVSVLVFFSLIEIELARTIPNRKR